MRTILYLVILILFTSCLTARRIEKNCDLFAKVCGTGTVTEIRYRDTIIYLNRMVPVFLPQDKAELKGRINITKAGAQMSPVTVKNGIVTVTAQVNNSELFATGYINQDSIIAHIRDSVLLKNAIRLSDSKTTVVVKEPYIPGFYKFTFWLTIIEFISLIGWLIVKFNVAGLVKTKL